MKKVILFIFCLCLFTTGCFGIGGKDVLKSIEDKYKNPKAYKLDGDLQITNNDDTYNYDVSVIFQKKDKFKVSLKNKANNHEQIILKNNDGVYVLTPSLNKSFKFQSDWPYNNSQIYLLQSIVEDIVNDKERSLVEKDDGYVYTTAVNYPNNRRLVKQEVFFNKDLVLEQVSVLDEADIPLMKMMFNNIDMDPDISDSTFDLNNIMGESGVSPSPSPSPSGSSSPSSTPDSSSTPSPSPSPSTTPDSSSSATGGLSDIIYPLYIPSGTKLTSEEKVKKNNGERVIMTFDGEKPFLLVEETATVEEEFSIIPTYGEPFLLIDTVGALSDNSITWTSGGVDYYLVSDVMSQDELLDVARSVNVIPTMK
ncbi:MAG: outer membrane lipoprotein carrier protein LolA [Bacilli bacterium]|nr:outer membrane lipoprotein carrier protein LolA [Bacilli bacterium]